MIELFDSTLRDGAQGEGISYSVRDKLRILQTLDEFGIDFIKSMCFPQFQRVNPLLKLGVQFCPVHAANGADLMSREPKIKRQPSGQNDLTV